MNARNLLGIVLIVLGVVALAYQGITYTTRERVVDAGPIHVDADRRHTIPIAPIAGGAARRGGLALLVLGRSAKS